MKYIFLNWQAIIKAIAITQLIGSAVGIYTIATLLHQFGGIYASVFAIGLALYLLSAYSAKRLLFDKEKKHAIIFSVIALATQTLSLGVFGYNFGYHCGLSVRLSLSSLYLTTELMPYLDIGPQFEYHFYLSLNCTAVVFIFLLVKLYHSPVSVEKTANEVAITSFP